MMNEGPESKTDLMKSHFTKLLKRYWSFVRHCGIAKTERNMWIAGNLVAMHCDIVPEGSALTWGKTDRRYSDVCNLDRIVRNKDELFVRAVNAALERDWDTQDGPTLHPMLDNFDNWNFQGIVKTEIRK